MKRIKTWGLVALLILVALEVLTIAPKKLGTAPEPEVAKIEEKKPGETPPPSTVATMSQTMQGVHLVETGGGRKQWELDSQMAQGFKDKGTWKLQGVKVKFFSLNGSIYSVTGHDGDVQMETKDMFIEGNVVTTTSEGYTFKTKSLKYSAQDKSLTTPDTVRITGPKAEGTFQVDGTGFRADLQNSSMKLDHNVHAIKQISSNGGEPPTMGAATDDQDGVKIMNIKSERSYVNGKTSEVHFEDQVQVDIESIRMTGNQADFLYDKKTKALASLLMQGNVRVTDQEHWAASQYAQVLFKQNEFVLYGNPRINQNGNELRGNEIRFLKGGKEVKVSKAKARMDQDEGGTGSNRMNLLTKGFSKGASQ
jgi:LPS export ABC transporter protein LptC